MPSIPERQEAKLAGGRTRREWCVKQGRLSLVDTARWTQGATDSIWGSVLTERGGMRSSRDPSYTTNH